MLKLQGFTKGCFLIALDLETTPSVIHVKDVGIVVPSGKPFPLCRVGIRSGQWETALETRAALVVLYESDVSF